MRLYFVSVAMETVEDVEFCVDSDSLDGACEKARDIASGGGLLAVKQVRATQRRWEDVRHMERRQRWLEKKEKKGD